MWPQPFPSLKKISSNYTLMLCCECLFTHHLGAGDSVCSTLGCSIYHPCPCSEAVCPRPFLPPRAETLCLSPNNNFSTQAQLIHANLSVNIFFPEINSLRKTSCLILEELLSCNHAEFSGFQAMCLLQRCSAC